MKKNRTPSKKVKFDFSPAECSSIIEASILLNTEIVEMDLHAPAKIRACIGSAVAKLENFNCNSNEQLPLTKNEFIAIHWALSYTLDLLKNDSDAVNYLDDSLLDSGFLSSLLAKISDFLLSIGIKLV